MKQIIGASFVVLCDAKFSVIKKGGILFENGEIVAVDSYLKLRKTYKEAKFLFYENCALTPAFANMHLHLEFSKNYGDFCFGDFGEWLDSVILKREGLMENLTPFMQEGVKQCLKSGVGFVGAVSSNGLDLEVLEKSPLRVLYFNEIIGSNVEALDFLYQNFLERFKDSKARRNPKFTPAVAIHAPYSVHPMLLKKVLDFAKKQDLIISTHFLESKAEKEWLESSGGYFKGFYQKFFNKELESFYKPLEFLENFKDIKNLYFTHCLEADLKELESLEKLRAKIITCPKSNRLLNNKLLDLDRLKAFKIPLCVATDGISSNDSLNLLDELRVALFGYCGSELESLAKELILSVTRSPFLNTPFKLGELKAGNLADFALFRIPLTKEFLAHNLILYTKEAEALYINGEEILQCQRS
ncbi:MAG: aminofutalosine deaminase family hydrolase [Helicobacter sp.]|nr:aminofutalosine deaminase family hydrolase [Helicobacter sp.]